MYTISHRHKSRSPPLYGDSKIIFDDDDDKIKTRRSKWTSWKWVKFFVLQILLWTTVVNMCKIRVFFSYYLLTYHFVEDPCFIIFFFLNFIIH